MGVFFPLDGGLFRRAERLDRSDEAPLRNGCGLGDERSPAGEVDGDGLVVLDARAAHGHPVAAGDRADGEHGCDRGAAEENFEIGVR